MSNVKHQSESWNLPHKTKIHAQNKHHLEDSKLACAIRR